MSERKNALQYAATSANLFNFLGNDCFSEHLKIYNSVVENALNAHKDMLEFSCEQARIIDPCDILKNINSYNPIFVTFHIGSFNMLVTTLLKMDQKFYVLSDTQSCGNADYKSVTNHYRQKFKNHCSLEMMNVEKEGTIFNLIKKIKTGAITVAYLDGNKGIGGQTKLNQNLLNVKFLNGIVRVRKGLAFMSYITKSPVVLVLNYREKGVNYLKVYEPIKSGEKNRELYCVEILEKIFYEFETHLKKYIEQWSNWPFLHNWSDLEVFKINGAIKPNDFLSLNAKDYTFNTRRFCPLKIDEKYYLFDRKNYILHLINPDYISIFSYKTSLLKKQQAIHILFKYDPEIAKHLIHQGILVTAISTSIG